MCSGGVESVNLYNTILLTFLLINVFYYGSNENDSIFYFGQVIGDIAQCAPQSTPRSGRGLPHYWTDASQCATPVHIQLL